MTQSNQIDHILGMISYLSSGLGHAQDSIKKELIRSVAAVPSCREITSALAKFGDADCLEAYVASHGAECFQVLRTQSLGGSRNPIREIGILNGEHFTRCVVALKPILESSSASRNTVELLKKSKKSDTPEIIEPCMDALNLSKDDIRNCFFDSHFTFNMSPRYAQWMSTFMQEEMSPEKLDQSNFGAHVDSLLRQGDVHGIAAYIRLGYDITPGFQHGLIRDQGNEWFNRLARTLQSAHDTIEILSRLPSLDEIMAMEKTPLTHLIAGMSNKEKRAAGKRQSITP